MKLPTLYVDNRSPPVRACLMLIKILGIDVNLKIVDLFKGDQLKSEFVELNPVHTVPTLTDDQITLTDSHSILIYMCEQYGGEKGSKLYPSNDRVQRTKIINKLFFESSILFRRDSDMMSEIVRKGYKAIDLPFHERKILESYGMLDTFLATQKYISGDTMTIADLSVATTLSTVDLMFHVTADKWSHLHTWFDEMRSLEAYKEGNVEGLERLKTTIEKIGQFEFPKRNAE